MGIRGRVMMCVSKCMISMTANGDWNSRIRDGRSSNATARTGTTTPQLVPPTSECFIWRQCTERGSVLPRLRQAWLRIGAVRDHITHTSHVSFGGRMRWHTLHICVSQLEEGLTSIGNSGTLANLFTMASKLRNRHVDRSKQSAQ